MYQVEPLQSKGNCVNIFFPNSSEIKEYSSCYLYGIIKVNTFVILLISQTQITDEKYIESVKIETKDYNEIAVEKEENNVEKKDTHKLRLIGEMKIFPNEKYELERINRNLNRSNKNGVRPYLYLCYYNKKPVCLEIHWDDEISHVLFILYNTKKFHYTLSFERIKSLVRTAFHKPDIHTKCKKEVELDIPGGIMDDKICNVQKTNVTSKIKYRNKKGENYTNSSIEKPRNENEEEGKKDCSNKFENETENLLDLKEIISLINNSCLYKEHASTQNKDRDFSKEIRIHNKKKSFVEAVILCLLYIVSSISGFIYYIMNTQVYCKVFYFFKKSETLELIKENSLIHSEWHSRFEILLNDQNNPKIYYESKEILLIRFFNLLVDIVLGCVLHILISSNLSLFSQINEKFRIFHDSKTLTSILGILIQNPLGFKLNNNFTVFIGSIIVSVLDKWEFFMYFVTLNEKNLAKLLSYFSLFGVSLFLSLIIDYLVCITSHVLFIYIFLKKMCCIFHSHIYSLYLLFNGKKWNVLKLRVDTNIYSNEEVILGTILFSIFIFLYPTIFIFALVFGIIYYIIQGIIYTVRFLKAIILFTPFYIFLLPPHFNKYISSGIKFTQGCSMEMNPLKKSPTSYYLLLQNNSLSLFQKIKFCIDIIWKSTKLS